MKKLLIASLLSAAPVLAGPLRVVTTIPDLADFTRQVGGSHVEVYSLASGAEDPHNVLMKPSMIIRLSRTELFIQMGMEFEHAYAPALVKESRNTSIAPGKPGFLDTSVGITPFDVPESLDKAEGDVHPAGNPHYNLSPDVFRAAVGKIADKLAELDPANAAGYEANAAEYLATLDAKIHEWKTKLDGKNIRFVSFHPHFVYFADAFGVKLAGTIESKPGIEPGPKHIEELVATMKREHAGLIVHESFFSDRIPNEIAKRTGARVATVPIMVGAMPGATDYIKMMDLLVQAFAGE